jgi:ribosomal protein S12 methylthiotransferase accessory factor YcaO
MRDEDLPPELARIRQQDYEAHLQKARAAGLTEEQARAHAREELRERDALERAELQTPGQPIAPDVPDRSGKPGKERRAP